MSGYAIVRETDGTERRFDCATVDRFGDAVKVTEERTGAQLRFYRRGQWTSAARYDGGDWYEFGFTARLRRTFRV